MLIQCKVILFSGKGGGLGSRNMPLSILMYINGSDKLNAGIEKYSLSLGGDDTMIISGVCGRLWDCIV